MAAIGDFIDKDVSDGLPVLDTADEVAEQAQPAMRGIDLSFLKAQTGAGQIEDYVDHALNFNGSKSVARIIRGLTGLIGELNYAIVDILLGVLEMGKDRKKAVSL